MSRFSLSLNNKGATPWKTEGGKEGGREGGRERAGNAASEGGREGGVGGVDKYTTAKAVD